MNIRTLLHSKIAGQTGFLLIATISNIITQIVINAALARSISQEDYGNYSYFINLFTFCQTIFNFGFFYTICRIVSTTQNQEEIRTYYYEGLKFLSLTAVILVACLYIYSFIDLPELKRNGIEQVFWIIAPFSFVYLITNFNEQILQGNNRIRELALSRALPKFTYALLLGILFILHEKFSILGYLFLYLGSHFVIYFYLIKRIGPRAGAESKFKEIFKQNRKFGLNIYLGSLLSVGVANMMGLIISKYCPDNVQLGYYNIALQITIPLTLIPNILSTVLFAKFAKNPSLSPKIIYTLLLISITLYTTLYFLSDLIICLIFGDGYLPAAKLIKILGLGSLLYGMADFFNRYILARGKASAIRNISITIGLIYLASGFILIPKQYAEGASYAKVFAGLIYFILEVIVVRYYLRKERLY
ncbi:oligosaccharide flippase family protein [bacterium]|nr:oligosaccharide flippase family protein [bacterium]